MSSAVRSSTRNARRDAVRRGKASAKLRGRAANRPRPPACGLNPSRADPSRTGQLRVKAGAAVKARFARLRAELYRAVVLEDALGLADPPDWFAQVHNWNPNQARDAAGRFAEVRGGGTASEIEKNIRSGPAAAESHVWTQTREGREIPNLFTVVPQKQRDAAFKDVMKWANSDLTHMKEFTFTPGQLSAMVTPQPNLKEENLVKWVKAEKVPGGADAFLHDGTVYLRDANHRAAAAVLRGESFKVRLVLRKDSDFTPEHLTKNAVLNFDPNETRDRRGRWARVGGRALSALQRAGAQVGHLEHSAKSYVEDRLEAGVSRLHPTLQHAVRATVHAGRVGTRAAFATWTAGQALAERVSRERGASPDQARRLRGVLSALDVATFKPVSLGLAATGVHAATLGLASFVPPASAAYLAYSTARDPVATWRAAKGLVRDAAWRTGVTLAGGRVQNANDLAWNHFDSHEPRDDHGRWAKVAAGITSPTLRPAEPDPTDMMGQGVKRFVVGKKAAERYGVRESVPIDSITATQKYINPEKLKELLAKPSSDTLILVRQGGKVYVGDGHHRIETEKIKGRSRVEALVIDVDEGGHPTRKPTGNSALTLAEDAAEHLKRCDSDLGFAVLLAALDSTGDLRTALPLAGRAMEDAPLGNADDEVTDNAIWSHLPTADRLKAFGEWLTNVAADLWRGLEETINGIAELAIRKGAGRSFDEARAGHFLDPNFRAGARDQFVDGVLRDRGNQERFDALRKRNSDEQANHRDSVVEKVERSISDAVIQEKSPTQAWKEIATVIDREQGSAVTTVNDEVVRDHAEGQIAGFEEAGVAELFPKMEWTVHPEASRSGVCPRCWAMRGTRWTIEDARGKIPLHRNCKCTWAAVPAEDKKDRSYAPAPTRYLPGTRAKRKGKA